MPRKLGITKEDERQAFKMAETAMTADELRMVQSVILTCSYGLNLDDAGKITGRSRATIARGKADFITKMRQGKVDKKQWGGRRKCYLDPDTEKEFVSSFLDKASKGGVVVVSEIKNKYEKIIGKKVSKTTIYRLLERQGWRKISPRKHHPKMDETKQEDFKKKYQNKNRG